MFDFNSLKGKVIDSISKAADTTKVIADKATDKAKDVSRIAKLSLEISSEKDVIKKAYAEIGKLYYEAHRDDPDGVFVQLCDEVTLAMENIASKEAEINELKNRSGDADDDSIVVEFEHIVDDEPPSGAAECTADDFEPDAAPDPAPEAEPDAGTAEKDGDGEPQA